jgi:hypothetical protein
MIAIVKNLSEKCPSRYTLQIETNEINVYGKMILKGRLGDGNNDVEEELSNYFREGRLNIEKLRRGKRESDESPDPIKWW